MTNREPGCICQLNEYGQPELPNYEMCPVHKSEPIKKWTTKLQALDANTGKMKEWMGDIVEATTVELAQQWCNQNKGYLQVIGEFISEQNDN